MVAALQKHISGQVNPDIEKYSDKQLLFLESFQVDE